MDFENIGKREAANATGSRFDAPNPRKTEEIPNFKGDDGNYIKAVELENEVFIVRAFSIGPNRWDPGKEMARITVELEGQTYTWNTSGTAIKNQLANATLPFRTTLIRRRGKNATYYSFADPDTVGTQQNAPRQTTTTRPSNGFQNDDDIPF